MSAQRLEAFLALLYTDAAAREEFLADPSRVAVRAGLDPTDIEALTAIDRTGLELAARSFEKKRLRQTRPDSAWRRWLGALGRPSRRKRWG